MKGKEDWEGWARIAVMICRSTDWTRKFSRYGLTVLEMTGDCREAGDCLAEFKAASLIVTTPEKFDFVSRRVCLQAPELIRNLRLVMIDEVNMMVFSSCDRQSLLTVMVQVHTLNDRERGHVMEAVVSRLKALDCPARYIAASATFPNVEDIALWLGGLTCVFYKFGEEVRPVQLRRVVLGFSRFEGQSEFK